MPGETADDGLAACGTPRRRRSPATFTVLGENVDDLSQATAAAGEYLRLLDRIDALGMDAEVVAVKLTQLGFDLEPDRPWCTWNGSPTAGRMGKTVVPIDMESSAYVDENRSTSTPRS